MRAIAQIDDATLEREIGRLAARLTELRRLRSKNRRRALDRARATSPRILAIKKAYLEGNDSVGEIARAFKTSTGHVQRLVREFDWPRRSPVAALSQSRRRAEEALYAPASAGQATR